MSIEEILKHRKYVFDSIATLSWHDREVNNKLYAYYDIYSGKTARRGCGSCMKSEVLPFIANAIKEHEAKKKRGKRARPKKNG